MTHATLNLLALNVRSKVTRVQQAGSAMSLVHWLQEGDSSMSRETDGATAVVAFSRINKNVFCHQILPLPLLNL